MTRAELEQSLDWAASRENSGEPISDELLKDLLQQAEQAGIQPAPLLKGKVE